MEKICWQITAAAFMQPLQYDLRSPAAKDNVGREECSVKCEVWRKQWEVRSVKCGMWSVKCGVWSLSLECEERSVKCEVWSVRFGVWRKQWEVRSVKCGLWSVKCGVWSVKCGVWSLKFGVRRVQCEVWSVKTLLRLSLLEGRTRSGQVFLRTIGHLFLGNFRRRLARVYVIFFVRGDALLWHRNIPFKPDQQYIC